RRAIRGGAAAWGDARLRGGGGGRNPAHPRREGGPRGELHPVAGGHRQRDLQLHPVENDRRGDRLLAGAERSAGAGLRGSGPDAGHRGHGLRSQAADPRLARLPHVHRSQGHPHRGDRAQPRRERQIHRERDPEGPRQARGGAGGDRDPRGAGARHARGAGEDRPAARRGGRHDDDPGGRRSRVSSSKGGSATSKGGSAPLRAAPADCAGEAGARNAVTAWPGIIERYRRYLPVTEKTPVVTLLEGNTPLLPAPRLAEATDPSLAIFLKCEGFNPTGSFKDRGMTMAMSKAVEAGSRAVICASTGNTSASAAAFAARAGLRAFVMVPRGSVALGKLSQAAIHGARVLMVEGNFDQALDIVRRIAETHPVTLVNSVNPFRLE